MGKGNLNMGFCDAATPRADNSSICIKTNGTAPVCDEYCKKDNTIPGCEFYFCQNEANKNDEKCTAFCMKNPSVDYCIKRQYEKCMSNCRSIGITEDICKTTCKNNPSYDWSTYEFTSTGANNINKEGSTMDFDDSISFNLKGKIFSTLSTYTPYVVSEGFENGKITTSVNSGAKERYLNTKMRFNNETSTSYHLGVGILVAGYFLFKMQNID